MLRSSLNELHGHRRSVARVQRFRSADVPLDGQHVGAVRAVREDRRRPARGADRGPHPYGAEAATPSADDDTYLLRRISGQADKGPAIHPPCIPYPELGAEHDNHLSSIAPTSDKNSPRVMSRTGAPLRPQAVRQRHDTKGDTR